ncbi:glutamate--tRNA ligase [Desulfonatronum thioautotrophicum]|uniref:glutamate--tRNA ligase n=1 Tax=Desulfonatronum thioautotrophicum TaxID=617001 RepID=UPI0005EBB078|nr:glutamate--tRNA ligase [Desulfonatronum thioautotrophicum]
MTQVITRFPPSPTGHLHVGGARTALFNWLWARKNGGKFILRIEDTDVARSSEEMTQGILDGMRWLGLDWDEGPYFQSRRIDLYNQYIDQLLETGHAYFCACTPDEVEAMRAEARATGAVPKYNGRCRGRDLKNGPGRVVRFKTPESGETAFQDLVKGPVAVPNAQLDDMVLRRLDGMPTYNLAVVVDDVTMNLTHVIRGDDHLSNTPKQVLLYEALGRDLPRFAHVPMILGPDKKKLSKRHGATSVTAYRDMGYLPEAMVNYLVRLGWSHGDQEVFQLDELLQVFSLDHLGTAASVFDQGKLLWLNNHYIKNEPIERIASLLDVHLTERGWGGADENYLQSIVPLLQPRAGTMVEMAEMAEFFVVEDESVPMDPAMVDKFLTPEVREHFGRLRPWLAEMPVFDQQSLETMFKEYLGEQGVAFKVLAQPLRVALTGKTKSPGLYEIMEVLGKDRVLRRLARVSGREEEPIG